VVQGGDGEKGNGMGGPGYTIPDELPPAGPYPEGALAMANTGEPDTGGSQFFVITGPEGTQLPPQYSLFGKVSQGFDVVKKIEADGSPDPDPPKVVHKMLKVTITES
jgi:cyclophilin family peptidyl-prolyl cis-trans isomerase